MSISRAPWCLRWVGTEALGEVTLRPKSQRQLWTVLIWRWPKLSLWRT